MVVQMYEKSGHVDLSSQARVTHTCSRCTTDALSMLLHHLLYSRLPCRIRPRLSEEQRKDRPHIVILGTGTLCPFPLLAQLGVHHCGRRYSDKQSRREDGAVIKLHWPSTHTCGS